MIQVRDNPADYGLAVARWIVNAPSKRLNVGLKLIAPHVFSVTAPTSERHRRTSTGCLLVPELKSAHRPASLVAPVSLFRADMEMHIRHGKRGQRVLLLLLLESTGAFARFQFEYL